MPEAPWKPTFQTADVQDRLEQLKAGSAQTTHTSQHGSSPGSVLLGFLLPVQEEVPVCTFELLGADAAARGVWPCALWSFGAGAAAGRRCQMC